MSLRDLDNQDQALLRRCLEFVLEAEELEGQFETRLGVTPDEVRAIISRWPEAGDEADDSTATIAFNNAMNEIVHGLHVTKSDERRLGASRGSVQALYFRWAQARGWTATGLR